MKTKVTLVVNINPTSYFRQQCRTLCETCLGLFMGDEFMSPSQFSFITAGINEWVFGFTVLFASSSKRTNMSWFQWNQIFFVVFLLWEQSFQFFFLSTKEQNIFIRWVCQTGIWPKKHNFVSVVLEQYQACLSQHVQLIPKISFSGVKVHLWK